MITLEECAEFTGLDSSELITGSVLSTKHRSLLSSYLLNLKRGPSAVREMIVWDIRAAIDLGASKHAADLVLVLRLFLSKYPEGRIVRRKPSGKAPAYTTCRLGDAHRRADSIISAALRLADHATESAADVVAWRD